jgi:hypothetical protein
VIRAEARFLPRTNGLQLLKISRMEEASDVSGFSFAAQSALAVLNERGRRAVVPAREFPSAGTGGSSGGP